jgi:hypothetical protein
MAKTSKEPVQLYDNHRINFPLSNQGHKPFKTRPIVGTPREPMVDYLLNNRPATRLAKCLEVFPLDLRFLVMVRG